MKGAHNHSGFTLTELIMVIVLVGILAAYAVPRLGPLSSYSLNRASNELIEAIRYAQESSMVRVDSGFQLVSGGADSYRVSEYLFTSATTQQAVSPLTGTSPFVAASSEWSGISVSALNLSFDTRGYPCASTAPCNTPMSTPQTITLSAGGETRTLTIEPITGYVHAN